MAKDKIKSIKAREILDSRGNPTLEVELRTESGVFFSAVPSGASRGKNEAWELRDGGQRLGGKGVKKAVGNVITKIFPALKGKEVTNQKEIDRTMAALDGTENKSNLGGNSICGTSLAVCRAGAAAQGLPLWEYISKISNFQSKISNLPFPCFNVINGGAHAANELDVQEFMVVPQGSSFSENLKTGINIYHFLKGIISEKYGKDTLNLGDEGGFAAPLKTSRQALELIMEAAKQGDCDIKIILDVAASQFFANDKYEIEGNLLNREELADYYWALISKYPISGLEDPFAEDDWQGWINFNLRLNPSSAGQKSEILIIGDDLLVTNPSRIRDAKEKDAVNAMILKINQIGTVTEALEAAKLAKDFGWKIVVSHRSGETKDNFIADFAVGIGADFIKSGAPGPVERMAKYNRLLEIEKEMKK